MSFWPVSVNHAFETNREFIKIYNAVQEIGLPNYLKARCPVSSGLLIPAWRMMLADFPDTQLVDFLQFGLPLDYTSSVIPTPTLINLCEKYR